MKPLTQLTPLRLAAKLTQLELAAAAGVPVSTIQRLERLERDGDPGGASRRLRLDSLLRLADGLGVAPSVLAPRLAQRCDSVSGSL